MFALVTVVKTFQNDGTRKQITGVEARGEEMSFDVERERHLRIDINEGKDSRTCEPVTKLEKGRASLV